ncbi:protein of unknown function [Pustulibacterium marinum]|uniref:DUF4834 domain-containing protein n=1 Tax=Pustulibacterium marinum TaxID=1224947 RepID=A0A1I7FUF2_9FLAO|nr:DUF4834 family protein [Pustulibacterium marinum]SFU39780.1 protein of unknown function [Pustulibacterium marinum]
MQQAYLGNFLRTVIIIIGVLMLIRYVTKVFMPYILRYLVKKSEDHINKKFQGFQESQQHQNDYQDTNYTTSHKKQPKNDKKVVGEYIDFEEIE